MVDRNLPCIQDPIIVPQKYETTKLLEAKERDYITDASSDTAIHKLNQQIVMEAVHQSRNKSNIP